MRRLFLFTTLALSLVAAPLFAKPAPKKKPPIKDGVLLLIWGGGKSAPDADKAIDLFKELGMTSAAPLAKFESAKVEGLNPGFFIAVVGACPVKKGRSLLAEMRLVYDGVYARYVPKQSALASLGCPEVTLPKKQYFFEPEPDQETRTVEDKKRAGGILAHLVVSLESNGETMSASYKVDVTLTDGDKELDTASITPAASFAKIDDFREEGATLVLEGMEAVSDCGGDSFFEGADVRYTISTAKKKIKIDRKVTGRDSGLCSPNMEGLGGCELSRAMARYAASEAACRNVSRAKCDAALAQYTDEVECSEE